MTYHRFTMNEITEQVQRCRLISLMIEDCASMTELGEQHGNLPTMLPKMREMLDHLKMLADDAQHDLDFMIYETTNIAPKGEA